MTDFATNPGRSFPLGATVYPEGVNFSVFSKGAARVELLLFGEMDAPRPERVITLDPRNHRTYHYWHVFLSGLKAGQIYGCDHNLSWNFGVEGPTGDPEVESLRNRQVKNFLALTLLSFGTPMMLMGDEVRRSQRGNNNAYISWFDWALMDRYRDVHRFVKELIRLRLHFDKASLEQDLTLSQFLAQARYDWHWIKLHQPDWSADSHSLAVTAVSLTGARVFHLICNAYWEALSFQLPRLPDKGGWRRLIDIALPAPEDICAETEAVQVEKPTYLAQPRSVVLLFSPLLRKVGDREGIEGVPGSYL